jgi:hypothetical protein
MGKPIQGQGLRTTHLLPRAVLRPEIKAGDRVSARTWSGAREMATVLLKRGFRLRVRTDSGRTFSIDLGTVWLLESVTN